MATFLRDSELKEILGSVICNGDVTCIRPNSYILRLGGDGEFLNSGKEFELGTKKKGIKVQAGHSVAVTAFETIDFRRETVQKIFPGCDLHGFISPTTDLSREGIVAPATQVDAGYHGTPNWTITNTSSQERRFILKERLFRLTILKLVEGERPEKPYSGDYQGQVGYIRSQRKGPPVGMKDSEWADSLIEGGPEELLEHLIRTGYPWHILGERLKIIDQQLKTVTDEYADIHDLIEHVKADVSQISREQQNASAEIRSVVRDETTNLQNRWLVGSAAIILAFVGAGVSLLTNERSLAFLKGNGGWVGVGLLVLGLIISALILKRAK